MRDSDTPTGDKNDKQPSRCPGGDPRVQTACQPGGLNVKERVEGGATNGTRVVPLRGRPWQVFEYFWKNKERYVPADELMEPLEIPSIHSTRNAILRLNQALRAEGVEGALENRKGVGYRVLGGG